MPLTAGASFGAYKDVMPLGAGGMGEVWRARDPRLEREVALKVLPSSSEADESARKRLLREARMASKLNHPHICTVYEVGEAEGVPDPRFQDLAKRLNLPHVVSVETSFQH